MFRIAFPFCVAASLALAPSIAFGEILAMVNYETKSPESLKALQVPVAAPARKEGIAIIDVDPTSRNFGKIVQDIALPGDTRRAPHLLQPRAVQGLRDGTRQGGAARHRHEEDAVRSSQGHGGAGLQRRRRRRFLRRRQVLVPELHGHASDGRRRRLTDEPVPDRQAAASYPHGIAVHNGIDRILLSSTVRATDLGDAGEAISVIEASSGKALGAIKVSNKPSPAGRARWRSCSFPVPSRRWPTSPTCTRARCGPPPGMRGRRPSTCSRCTTSRRRVPACR